MHVGFCTFWVSLCLLQWDSPFNITWMKALGWGLLPQGWFLITGSDPVAGSWMCTCWSFQDFVSFTFQYYSSMSLGWLLVSRQVVFVPVKAFCMLTGFKFTLVSKTQWNGNQRAWNWSLSWSFCKLQCTGLPWVLNVKSPPSLHLHRPGQLMAMILRIFPSQHHVCVLKNR